MMSIESLKNIVNVALSVALSLAKITASTVDDTIVTYLQGIAASDTVWQIVAAFLGMGPVPTPTNGGGLELVGAAHAPGGGVILSNHLEAARASAGVSGADLNKALAGADLKGLDINQIAMLVQLVLAIFKAIKK